MPSPTAGSPCGPPLRSWGTTVKSRLAALLIAPMLGLGGCSLQLLETDECASSAECRAAFGFGSQCLTSGFCSEPFACSNSVACEEEFGMGSLCAAAGTCTAPTATTCEDNAFCEASIGLGSTCQTDRSCSRPELDACTANGECVTAFGEGAICGSNGFCRRSSACNGNDAICEDRLGAGAFCDDDDTCRPASAAECLTDPDCVPDQGFGSTCVETRCTVSPVSDCAGDSSICMAAFGTGSTCRTDNRCTPPSVTNCASDDVCVARYGAGSTCLATGGCTPATLVDCNGDTRACEVAIGAGSTCTRDICTRATACESAADCVAAFGFGHTCNGTTCQLPDVIDCTSNATCRNAYGWGSTCGSGGLCAAASPILQCRITEPADFWNRPLEYRNRITLGALISFSNNAVEKNAIELAIRNINAQNGVSGRTFAVVFCDYGTAADTTAANLATFLARDVGVPAIIGGFTSSATQAAFQAVSNLAGVDTVFISPSATSPALTEVDNVRPTDEDPGRIWTLVPTADAQTRILADRIVEDHPDAVRVTFLIENFAGAAEIEGLLIAELESRYAAGAVTAARRPFDRGNNAQLDAAVDGTPTTTPDAVIIITGLSTTLQRILARAGTRSGFDDVAFYVTDTGHDSLLLRSQSEIPDAILDSVVGVRAAPGQGSSFNRFASDYQSAFGQVPTTAAYSAHAFDAAWLAALGATWSILQEGELSALGIARGLRRVSSTASGAATVDFTIATQYLRARNAFDEGNAVRVSGASGAIAFDNATELLRGGIIELWDVNTACTTDDVDGRCFRQISRTELE